MGNLLREAYLKNDRPVLAALAIESGLNVTKVFRIVNASDLSKISLKDFIALCPSFNLCPVEALRQSIEARQ